MLEFEDFEEKTIHRQELYHGKIIDVALDDVLLPSGETTKRELVFHPGGVGLIALTDENKMVFVKQFRKPLERVILEIPAGKIEAGETDPAATGLRELEEETGYRASSVELITSMYLSPGYANERLYLYQAKGIQKVEHPLAQDEDEVIEVYELTLEEAKEAIKQDVICDAKSIYAVLYWELQMEKGRI
ncbi:MAG TPA: NUDIX hydrolase [Candidatus Tetragenococcus pullicola]|nr:NUDIX hydrolase [Candidatus Tetragenococcus pullicola]